jgi:hydroxyacylglutathione hydrolase
MTAPVFEPLGDDLYLLRIPFAGIWTGCLLSRKKQPLLIDSGADAAGVDRYIVPALRTLGLAVADLEFLLATHTHADHIGGHARLRELGVRRIGVFEQGADKLREPLKYNKLIRASFPEHSAPPAAKLDGVEPDFLFRDGDAIAGLTVLATPGHDSDSVSFFDPAGGTLFTGDSVQGNGTVTLGCALYMDLPAYEASLRRLLTLPLQRVVTGHPFLPWNSETVPGKQALTDSLSLLAKYDALISLQPSMALAERAAALIRALNDPMPTHLFLAMYTLREHLRRSETK